MAWLVMSAGSHGPLALAAAATKLLGSAGGIVFGVILLCVFVNTMTPAMAVNARQVACLTGLGFGPALAVAAGLVYTAAVSLEFQTMLSILSVTGVIAAAFVIYTACRLHKSSGKQQ
jgi:ABC-type antimicrobial peptide transport system permease subunit